MQNRQYILLCNTKACCQLQGAGFPRCVGSAYFAHVIVSEFCTGVINALARFRVLFVVFLQTPGCFFEHFRRSSSVPPGPSASTLRLRVSSIMYSPAFIAPSATFGFAVGYVIRLCSINQMLWVYAARVIAGVHNYGAGLFSVFQKVRDAVCKVRYYLSVHVPTYTPVTISVCPGPAPTGSCGSKSRRFIYLIPKAFGAFSGERGYFPHSLYLARMASCVSSYLFALKTGK